MPGGPPLSPHGMVYLFIINGLEKFLRDLSQAGSPIHTSAVWFGQGWAVWVSHPGQVGDRAGQLCGSVRVGQYGRAGQGSSPPLPSCTRAT